MKQGEIRAPLIPRFAILLTVTCLLGGAPYPTHHSGSSDLAGQQSFSRTLRPDPGVHHYHLHVPAHHAAVVTAFQMSRSDLRLEASTPAGRVASDHSTSTRGAERLTLVAGSRPTLFVLQVHRAGDPEVPYYSIQTEGPRPSRPKDEHRARAEQLWSEVFAVRKEVEHRSLARDRFRRAAEAWRRAGESLDRGQALLELAKLEQEDGDFDAMSRAATTALELFESLDSRRPDLEMESLLRVGLGLAKSSEADAALEIYGRASTLFREHDLGRYRDLRNVERMIREETGAVHWDLGQSLRARQLFDDLLADEEAKPEDRARYLGWLGRTDMDAGRMELARGHFHRVIELGVETRDDERQSIGLLLLAKAWRQDEELGLEERNRRALDLLGRSLELAPQDKVGQRIDILNEQAKAWRQLGAHVQAVAGYQRALDLATENGRSRDRSMILANRAVHEFDRGRLAAASRSLDEALALLESSTPPGLPTAAFLQRSARLAFTQEEYDRALDLARRAVALLDDAWTRSTDSSRRLRLGSSRRSYFELLVDIHTALHQRQPRDGHDLRALLASEWGRARLLLESMEHAGLDRAADAPSDLIADQTRTAADLKVVEVQLQTLEQASLFGRGTERLALEDLDERIAALRTVRREKEAALQRFDDQLRRGDPRFQALGLGPRLSVEQMVELQKSLPADLGVLVFFLGEERSHGWLIDAAGLTHRELPARAEIDLVAERFYDLQTRGDDPTLRPEINALAHGLSELTLEPFAEVLTNRSLVVIPDGSLLRVPWVRLPKPGDPAAGPMLEHHELVTDHSLEVLANLLTSTTERRRDGSLAVVGDPVFSDLDPRMPRPRQPSDPVRRPRGLYRDLLERLEATGTEAEAILSLVAPEQRFAAVGFEATRELVITGRLSGHDIIHIATHGVADPDTTPYLALTQITPDGRPLDGRLTTRDIAGLDLSTNLVVLSACESGVGRAVDGEGLFSLSRAFMAAGAPRMVASLWEVDDEVTAELMAVFYHGLLVEELPPASALRLAQIEIMERPGSSTLDWAAWTLIGSPTW
jgi:CHAT domain-containing protein